MIAILDYDAGNLKSVEKALTHLGEESIITRDRREVERADKLILPGVMWHMFFWSGNGTASEI